MIQTLVGRLGVNKRRSVPVGNCAVLSALVLLLGLAVSGCGDGAGRGSTQPGNGNVPLPPATGAISTVVHWYGNYAAPGDPNFRGVLGSPPAYPNESADLDGGGSLNDYRSYVAYSDTTPLNPTAGVGYSTTMPSAIFFGGVLMESYNRAFSHGPWGEVWSGNSSVSPNDQIYYSTSVGTRGWMFVFWKKEGFLAGQGGIVSLPAGSAFEVSGYGGSGGDVNKNSGRVRFAIQEAGQWYLSEAYGEPTATSFVLDPAATRWATYAPAAPYAIKFNNTQFMTKSFSDVQAVGLYHSNDNVLPPASSSYAGFTFLRFRVNARVN